MSAVAIGFIILMLALVLVYVNAMSAVAIGFIILLLVLVLVYAWRAPEVSICEHCTHMIQRSDVDEQVWFHCDTRRQTCYEHADSPIATPDPRIDFAI